MNVHIHLKRSKFVVFFAASFYSWLMLTRVEPTVSRCKIAIEIGNLGIENGNNDILVAPTVSPYWKGLYYT